MKSLSESVVDYLDAFLVSQGKGSLWTSVDWLDVQVNETSISANPVMNNGIIGRDVLGNYYKSQTFSYSLVFNHTADVMEMLNNGKMLEELSYYIKEQSKIKNYPDLSRGRIATGFSVDQTPFLSQIEGDNTKGIYLVLLQLEYFEPK